MYSSHDIAKIILSYMDESGDVLTNKKLQKLLYYVESWSLVYFDGLLQEDFEAWVHGPVVPSVYRAYKQFGYKPIITDYECGESPKERYEGLIKTIHLEDDKWELIKAVLAEYAGLASFQLEKLSHSEAPWQSARGNVSPLVASSNVIDKALMKTYYSSLLKDHGKKEKEEV